MKYTCPAGICGDDRRPFGPGNSCDHMQRGAGVKPAAPPKGSSAVAEWRRLLGTASPGKTVEDPAWTAARASCARINGEAIRRFEEGQRVAAQYRAGFAALKEAQGLVSSQRLSEGAPAACARQLVYLGTNVPPDLQFI